jgi:hypothetical protein
VLEAGDQASELLPGLHLSGEDVVQSIPQQDLSPVLSISAEHRSHEKGREHDEATAIVVSSRRLARDVRYPRHMHPASSRELETQHSGYMFQNEDEKISRSIS